MPTTSFSRILCDRKFVMTGVNEYFFFAQMASFVERYDVIYHPFPINSQYLRTWGVDSPEIGIERAMACVAVRIQIFRSR